jgi:hypothetical protein
MPYPRSVQDIMTEIDLATEPAVMSKREALEFLEQCSTELEGRMEALRDELREEA